MYQRHGLQCFKSRRPTFNNVMLLIGKHFLNQFRLKVMGFYMKCYHSVSQSWRDNGHNTGGISGFVVLFVLFPRKDARYNVRAMTQESIESIAVLGCQVRHYRTPDEAH